MSDNGPSFTGAEFKQFMKRNRVKHVYSAPYHPQSNGQAERMVRTFKESMKTLKEGDLQTKIDRLLFKYRITPNSATGKTPAQLMFQRELRTPFHFLQPGNAERVRNPAEREVEGTVRVFKEGDKVWARNYGAGDKWIAGTVERKVGNVTYEISFKESFQDKENSNRHVNHLKERISQAAEVSQSTVDVVVQRQVGEEAEGRFNEAYNEVNVPPIPVVCTNPPVSSTVGLRRSTRATRKPAWVEDFVMTK